MTNMTPSISKITALPKLDLHCHLDGSFQMHFVQNTLGLSSLPIDKLRAPSDCDSLARYLTCFDLPIACLQTKESIKAGVLDVLSQCPQDGVRYIELRFAPTCSVNNNLNYREIVEAALDGCKEGLATYGVHCNLILCAMRHHSPEENLKVLKVAREYLGSGVCALDLAGDEAGFPNSLFVPLFQEANRLHMPFTIHSGECGSVENVKLALELGAKRVGHGIALYRDSSLMAACKEARLGLELCPTSNFQTKAATDYSQYPLRTFLDAGLLATINTDNRTVSNTTMTKEILLALDCLQIREEDLQTLYKNSVEISFANDNIKDELYHSWK